jgi:hypothetical protein
MENEYSNRRDRNLGGRDVRETSEEMATSSDRPRGLMFDTAKKKQSLYTPWRRLGGEEV